MPIYMWSASEFLPDQRIVTLIFWSLVKIVDGDKLWMHDFVKDFGRKIVQQENAMDPAKRSRLWGHEEILQVLWKEEDETEEEREEEERTIEALGLCPCDDDFLWNINFTSKELERLPKLRFLELCGFQFSGELEGSLSNLRWLSWHFSPSSVDASNLDLKNLVILDLSRSNIDDQWPGWTEIGKATSLKVLNLTSCKKLRRTPDLSGYKALEMLILEDCIGLAEIDNSIGKLKQLKYLNLKSCNSLKGLPDDLCSAKALEEIVLSGMGRQPYREPKSFSDHLTSLLCLVISNFGIRNLPCPCPTLQLCHPTPSCFCG